MRVVCRSKPVQGSRHAERMSDCWPDWADADDMASLEESARKNAPAIVFGETSRVLLVVLAVIAAIEIALNILHIS